MKISIVIPLYNEEKIVVNSINETYESICHFSNNVEFIIVNDGSKDKTSELVLKHFSKSPFKFFNKINGGFGSAVKFGISKSSGNYVICVPADSPLNLKTASRLISVINENLPDVVLSYRKEKVGYSRLRLFKSKLYHLIVSILFSLNFKDYNWIHIYKSDIFKSINVKSDGIFFLSEVIIRAKRDKMRIIEVEVEQRQRLYGIASSTKLSTILNTALELLKFRIGISK
jgi:glycosyltransferase involved in cell wall biosynthesis